jgi:hypothetical protein
MSQRKRTKWPYTIKVRDTKINDDLGGLGQNIYTTSGSGYERQEYTRTDIHNAQIDIANTRTDIANARISELEAEIVTARADALRDVQRIKADRDQGMLDYCALMERYDAAIQNPTTEEDPCSPL